MNQTTKELIRKFEESEQYQWFTWGNAYYISDNTAINERTKKCYLAGTGATINPFQANHKLASGYFPKIVDQKVNYLLGNGVKFEDNTFDKDKYTEYTFDDLMISLATSASKKSLSWIYFYVDNSQLKMVEVPAEQILPLYDNTGAIAEIYRIYMVGSKKYVEHWTLEGVETYYIQDKQWKSKGLCGHYDIAKQYQNKTLSKEPTNFAVLPFIPLYNEPDKISDLKRIKGFIDIYDITNSDFANNIDDMQDAFFTLKNYNGAGLEEFLMQLKQMKAVPVGEDGEVKAEQLQIPVEARKVFLELTEKSIFKYAMAVDTTTLAGSSLTNVAIESQFVDLDLKADKFQSQFEKFIYKMIEFINLYEGASYDSAITLDRSMIVNKKDIIEMLSKLGIKMSQKTLVENNPLVDDAKEELAQIKKEEEEMMDSMGFDEPIEEVEEGEE